MWSLTTQPEKSFKSAAIGSKMTEIFVQLFDEGTLTFRPTQGVELGDNRYLVMPIPDYVEAEEVWEFVPGSVVICEKEVKGGEEVLVAKRLAESN
jgi:hypothetical protein